MNHRALIIGVGADLPNTVTDALGINQILIDPVRCGFTAKDVTLLTDTAATRIAILTALDALSSIQSDTTVLIYFSGHGCLAQSSMGESYYLMPYGYDVSSLYKTAISGQEFTERLRNISAQHLLLLLDCCHAGGMVDTDIKAPGLTLRKSPLPPETEQLFAKGSGRIIVASSQADEVSFVAHPYSLFTRALIECFSGQGVSKQDGYVRALDLALYAREKVPGWSNNRQHPVAEIERADNFIVAYYAGGEKTPKPLELPPIDAEKISEINPLPGQNTVAIGNIDLRNSQGANIGTQGSITQTFGPLNSRITPK